MEIKENNEEHLKIEKYSKVCIRLLKDVIYREDNYELWNILEEYLPEIRKYFEKIGLRVIYREYNGYCYLTQNHELDSELDNYKLIPKQPFTYQGSLLIILLREYLYNYDKGEDFSEKCIISEKEINEEMKQYLIESSNDSKNDKKINSAISELLKNNLIKELNKINENNKYRKFEIKRIIEEKATTEDVKEFLERIKNV